MTGDVCATCGLEKIGGRCLTRWCDDRHPSVDAVLDDLDEREIRTDGGTEHVEWWEKASNNVEKWGLQDVPTLLLAMQEEMGELAQAHLEARDEGGDPERVENELADLAALCFQLQWALNGRSLETGGEQR